MKLSLGLSLLFALAAFSSAPAVEVNGVEIGESAVLSDGTTLELNGAGTRKKFFVNVYVGALYLAAKSQSAEDIAASGKPNRVALHILYDELTKEKLVDAWNDGFNANQSKAQLAGLQERIDAFNALFPAVKQGDVVHVDYLPSQGTQVTVNEKVLGVVAGSDFNQAVLAIWLGKKPASKDLKKAMLAGG